MRADFYRDLHELNSHIAQTTAILERMLMLEEISADEIQRFILYFEELRSCTNTYLTSIFHEYEVAQSGRLSRQRREREMKDDPLHHGWKERELRRKIKPRKRN
jgi:hypothetical protein